MNNLPLTKNQSPTQVPNRFPLTCSESSGCRIKTIHQTLEFVSVKNDKRCQNQINGNRSHGQSIIKSKTFMLGSQMDIAKNTTISKQVILQPNLEISM